MATGGLSSGTCGWRARANSFGESAGELPRHVHQSRIRGDAIQDRQEPFGLGQSALPQVVLELVQCVIYSQPVIFQPLLEQDKVALLLKEAFENQSQLRRGAV